MIKKYDVEVILRLPDTHCMNKIYECICRTETTKELVDIITQAFKNVAYDKKIKLSSNSKKEYWYTSWYKVFKCFDIDEETKDLICNELSSYYDKDFSEYYGIKDKVNGGALFSVQNILRGKDNAWVFRNKLNSINIIEKMYDEITGERQYDASAFLDAVCKNR